MVAALWLTFLWKVESSEKTLYIHCTYTIITLLKLVFLPIIYFVVIRLVHFLHGYILVPLTARIIDKSNARLCAKCWPLSLCLVSVLRRCQFLNFISTSDENHVDKVPGSNKSLYALVLLI